MSSWERLIVCVIGFGATAGLAALAAWLHPGVGSQVAAVSAIVVGTGWMILTFIAIAEVLSAALAPRQRPEAGEDVAAPSSPPKRRRAA